MRTDLQDWLVHVKGRSARPVDAGHVRQVLDESDLGGDIVLLASGPSTISLAVATASRTELSAYHRVVARVNDALGLHWTVEADRNGIASVSVSHSAG